VLLGWGGDYPKDVNWLWKGFLAFGQIHILEGLKGVGKGLFLADLEARLAAGQILPDGSRHDTDRVVRPLTGDARLRAGAARHGVGGHAARGGGREGGKVLYCSALHWSPRHDLVLDLRQPGPSPEVQRTKTVEDLVRFMYDDGGYAGRVRLICPQSLAEGRNQPGLVPCWQLMTCPGGLIFSPLTAEEMEEQYRRRFGKEMECYKK
jgi:hypothetical protein